VDRWRRLVSRMGQSVWPGKKIGGQRANRKGGRVPPADLRPKAWFVRSGHLTVRMHGHQLQCMVKRLLKLFRRGFFFPRCAAVGCLMVRERAPSCLRVALLRPALCPTAPNKFQFNHWIRRHRCSDPFNHRHPCRVAPAARRGFSHGGRCRWPHPTLQ
jgi:hypothetical protein